MEKLVEKVDIIILGSGIAGLWTYHVLREKGYNAILLENKTLGGTQTLSSQGMVHGGQRYTLQGSATKHSESIAAMPAAWSNCLAGNAIPNLKEVKILSENQYLWSPGGLTSNVTAFFASKAMRSRVDSLAKEKWPEIFKVSEKFKGKIYELDEVVLDVKTLIEALASPYSDGIYKVDSIDYNVENEEIKSLVLNSELELSAEKYIFTAATGNEEIAKLLSPKKEITQRRPLKQIMVKEIDHSFYGHCLTVDPRPRVTVSTHPLSNGKYVWYLGGLVAVNGVDKSDDQAISFAKKELNELMPWIDWNDKDWSCYYVDRAEPKVTTGFLPDGPVIKEVANALLVWPTKLTYAPAIGTKVESYLGEVKKSGTDSVLNLPKPELGAYPWEECTWQ